MIIWGKRWKKGHARKRRVQGGDSKVKSARGVQRMQKRGVVGGECEMGKASRRVGAEKGKKESGADEEDEERSSIAQGINK
jgi:hypothetical protein